MPRKKKLISIDDVFGPEPEKPAPKPMPDLLEGRLFTGPDHDRSGRSPAPLIPLMDEALPLAPEMQEIIDQRLDATIPAGLESDEQEEPKKEIDIALIRKAFPLGSRWKLIGEIFYIKMILVVCTNDENGIVFENELEVRSNRLSTKVKHCFGWPPMDWYFSRSRFIRQEDEDHGLS